LNSDLHQFPPPDQLPVIDLPSLLEEIGGDSCVLDEVVALFRAGLPAQRRALEGATSEAMARVAHTLKGSCAQLRAPRAAAAASHLEETCRSRAEAGEAHRALLRELDALEAALERRAVDGSL
jgi:HPt (histidine-containing phosphotransfer) domain-containing protein